jgi:hypothetical protein
MMFRSGESKNWAVHTRKLSPSSIAKYLHRVRARGLAGLESPKWVARHTLHDVDEGNIKAVVVKCATQTRHRSTAAAKRHGNGTRPEPTRIRDSWKMSELWSSIASLPAGPDAEQDGHSVLHLEPQIRQEMEKYGLGHPKSSELAIIYAEMCNAAAKRLLAFEGRRLRLAKALLETANRVLKLDSSYLLFLENRKALALTYNNFGCLYQKQARYQVH